MSTAIQRNGDGDAYIPADQDHEEASASRVGPLKLGPGGDFQREISEQELAAKLDMVGRGAAATGVIIIAGFTGLVGFVAGLLIGINLH